MGSARKTGPRVHRYREAAASSSSRLSAERMGERVFFAEVGQVKARADALFAKVDARVRSLLPSALVEHVGSTSLPDGLTKGDLDVQVRVRAEDCLLRARPDLRGNYDSLKRSFHGGDM